ncbi:MAG: MlaD family protein [Gemmatimonadaceae bacterium]
MLIPGLIALLAIVTAVASVLLFARVGALHGDTYRLYMNAEQARGVLAGTEVWLAGKKIGLVESITFRSPASDTTNRLLVALEVLTPYRPWIRGDSRAQIASGGSFIGAPVVHITPGTPAAPPLADGALLRSSAQVDAEQFASDVGLATREFPEIFRNVRMLNEQVKGVTSAFGDRPPLALVVPRVMRFGARALEGKGTLALVVGEDDPLARRAESALARVDSVMATVAAGKGTAGRITRDSLLAPHLQDMRNELSIIRALLAEPRGTAGRILADSAIRMQVGRAERELAATIADMKKNPFRYVPF